MNTSDSLTEKRSRHNAKLHNGASIKKTILVTGGAGFVGSHLCERLQKQGHRVISLDNYFTGSRENHRVGVEYREGHTKDIEKLIPETPDIVYHLGEYSRVEQSVLEPEIVHDLNTVGTAAVVRFWQKKKCKLLYAGSSTKFGDGGATRHTSPYASTKAENTELVRDTGERERLPYAITYFYNVYGPRERSGVYGTVIEHFKRMYSAGAPCAIVNPGTQERNFTHVDDIVAGLVLAGEKGSGDEYGLGNESAFSIFDVANLFGFGKDIVMFPERPGNRMKSSLDTKKITALGWHTERSLPEYIAGFTKANSRGKSREKRILVFSTTMHPIAGLAEEAFAELAAALPDVSFDVVTTRFTRTPDTAPTQNITLHHVGFGTPFDKFLLPLLGALKGLELRNRHTYLFTWSLMASYATLAGVFLKTVVRVPLLVTLADHSLSDLPMVHRWLLSLMMSQADQVYGTHGVQEKDAMRAAGASLPRTSLGEGDAFANALRYAYADVIRRRQEKNEPHKKKILIFSLAYFPKHVGGAEIAIKEITDRIPPSDFEFHLITLRFEKDAPREEKIGAVTVHRVGGGSSYFSKIMYVPLAALKALSMNRIHKFDGLWAMMSYMLFPIMIMRSLGLRTPYALSLQEGDPFEHVFNRPHVAFLSPILKAGFRNASVIQAISTFLGTWAHTAGFRGSVEIIPNGADLTVLESSTQSSVDEVKDMLGKKMGDVFLITTSRLVHKNAVDNVLKALPLLAENVHFLILGIGSDEEKLRHEAKRLGVEARVKFLGFIEQSEIPKYLKASDIFIRPSRSEGMGNSFIEAMAAGLPVIATQEGGIADFLFDEKKNPDKPITGFAVTKDSPQEISEAVKNIMSHPEKVRAVVRTSQAMVREKYDWDLIARTIQQRVFERL